MTDARPGSAVAPPMTSRVATALVSTSVLGAGVFVALGALVKPPRAAFRFDLAVSQALHDGCPPALVRFLRVLAVLGEGWLLAVFAVVGGAALLLARRRIWAAGWAAAFAGGGIISTVLKLSYARARPSFAHPLATANGFSFPSGHAMGAVLFAGMLAYLGSQTTTTSARQAVLVMAAVVWVLVMGLSRIVLGVHYPSDVLGGYAVAASWLSLCVLGLEIAKGRSASSDQGQMSRSR